MCKHKIVFDILINQISHMLPNKKVKEIHKSFSTLNTLADVSHVYAYFILSCSCGKRREIMNLMNIETVIGQRFLCGVNREIVA
jgi:hypothetical protein